MAWTYTITIAGVGTVKVESLSQVLKIDESLDSALMVIPRVTRKDTYPRFAMVTIVVSDGTITNTSYWQIWSDKSEVAKAGTTLKYEHTLGLIEPTKLLEKYPCGSLTFTQPLGGTQETLYDVVERLRTLCPFVRYEVEDDTRAFVIDSALATELDGILAPQLYFDKKNLREALIEVFKYINAIPRIEYQNGDWVLVADKTNDRHYLIPFTVEGSHVIDFMTEITGENYATKVECFQENVIPSDDRSTANVFSNSITDVVTFRNDGVILGSGNFKLILSHKIDKLISITAVLDTDAYAVSNVDLIEYVLEKKVYETLDYKSGKGTRACSAYWTYGSDMIEGFDETFGADDTLIAVESMIADAVAEQFSSATTATWEDIPFTVTYIPFIETMRSEQYREDLTTNTIDTTIQINPSERINNAYKTTSNVYGQIQRLGVDTYAFSKKHKDLSAYVPSTNEEGIYSLGDYTSDGYMITTIELVFFNSFLIARYEMSLNFNRIAQFIGIDKQFRPYEIALTKSDYTLKRDIMLPFRVIEINTAQGMTAGEITAETALITPFMRTFSNGSYALPISTATLQTRWLSNGTVTGSSTGVLKPLIIMAEKNTIKFKMDFTDTKIAGKSVTKTSEIFAIIYTQSPIAYTLPDGTMEIAKIELYGSYWDLLGVSSPFNSDHYRDKLVVIGNKLPYIDTDKNVVYDGATPDESFVKANIYATATEFIDANPGIGVAGQSYLGLDTMVLYEAVSATEYAQTSDFIVALKNNPVYTLPYYRVLKDASEILGFEMTLPIMPNKDKVNTFIIGDMLSQDNVLVKARTAKTLKYYYSAVPFTKANTKKPVMTTTAYTVPSITDNYIVVPSAVYTAYDYYAIGDNDGNLYIAVNQKNMAGTKTNVTNIYFNFLTERTM